MPKKSDPPSEDSPAGFPLPGETFPLHPTEAPDVHFAPVEILPPIHYDKR